MHTCYIIVFRLTSSLRDYADFARTRLQDYEAMQVHDPRSEEEKMAAADLDQSVSLNLDTQRSLEHLEKPQGKKEHYANYGQTMAGVLKYTFEVQSNLL